MQLGCGNLCATVQDSGPIHHFRPLHPPLFCCFLFKLDKVLRESFAFLPAFQFSALYFLPMVLVGAGVLLFSIQPVPLWSSKKDRYDRVKHMAFAAIPKLFH